jgi:hypothetical protein
MSSGTHQRYSSVRASSGPSKSSAQGCSSARVGPKERGHHPFEDLGDVKFWPGKAQPTSDLPLQGLQDAPKQVRLREVEPDPADLRFPPGYGDPQRLGAVEWSKPGHEPWH